MDDLQQDTRQLNQNIDRLEAKIQQLQSKLNSDKKSSDVISTNSQDQHQV